ncbi:hypothetical protein PT974_06079 [Cladobotryum mycophilum]|uniref:Uncharacterized protein n=1 Tax=Cladobotryum mycophilum TaxID=491253 RepID=A0ABR0SKH2_9HYPO
MPATRPGDRTALAVTESVLRARQKVEAEVAGGERRRSGQWKRYRRVRWKKKCGDGGGTGSDKRREGHYTVARRTGTLRAAAAVANKVSQQQQRARLQQQSGGRVLSKDLDKDGLKISDR